MLKTGFGTLVVIFDLKKKERNQVRFAIFITQRACCCFHVLCLCLYSVGFRSVCLVSHWHTPDTRCHGFTPTLLCSPSAVRGPPEKCICFNNHTWLHQQRGLKDPKQGPQLENAVPKEVYVVLKDQPRAVTIRQDLCASLPGIGSQPASLGENGIAQPPPGLSGLPVLSRGTALGGFAFRHSLRTPLPEASSGGSSCKGQELLPAMRPHSEAQAFAPESRTHTAAPAWLAKPGSPVAPNTFP